MKFFNPARIALVLAVAAAACGGDTTTPAWHDEQGYRWRDLRVSGGDAGFTRLDGGKTGINFQNVATDSLLLGNRMLGQGAGVALGDVDGDGLVDVFLAKTQGCSALYRNLGNWKFEEIATAAGVGACDRHSTGAAFADIDADGDLDLLLLATRGPNAIFINDGHAKFTERRDLGLDTAGRGGTTLTMADADGDGRLELFVANYKPYNLDDSLPPQRRSFAQMVREVAPGKFEIVPEHRSEYKIVNRPDMGGQRMTQRAEADGFYTYDGSKFVRVPMTGGRFRDARGAVLGEESESFGLGAKFVDLNGDGAPELYVANDFEDNDQLWLNDGRGNFRLADFTSQRQMSNSTMGVDVADLNGDGLPDLFCADMLSADTKRLKTQIPTNTAFPKKPGDIETQLQQQRNTMFINRGDGTFAEVASAAGTEATGWSWGTMLQDVDLDGWQDILVANGHLWDVMDADTQERLQNRLTDIPWQRVRWEFPKLPLKNVALRNRGDMTFEDVSAKWRFGADEDVSHALASADLDGDGDLDVIVNRLGSPALVLRNDAAAPRVAVRVTGDAPNTRAVGAKIRVLGGAVPLQEREVVVGGLYLSHSDYLASFAMGKSDSATIVIDWRDGRRTTIAGVKPNRLYEVTTANAGVRPAPDSAAESKPAVLFADESAALGGHVHTEDVFDDWDRQFLLPAALSELGPGVTWYDVDRDGDEDLLIGAGRGGSITVFRNDRGRLVREAAAGPGAAFDYTTLLGWTENGVSGVMAGVATWQARALEQMTQTPAAVRFPLARGRASLPAKAEPLVGSHESSTGPLAMADYDGDGDLDLFVGSRAIPMRYPVAASSGMFKNEGGGRFVLDASNSAKLKDVGLVSSGLFADVNGDGFDDLLVAREWGSILLLLNDGRGQFAPAPESWGLSRWTSRWNGIAAGDLNGDGRLDLIATSWGRNTAAKADSARPLVLVHGPFGAAGEEEMLMAREDPRIRSLAPLNSFARLRVAMPELVNRVPNFAAYADANVDKVLGPAASRVQRLQAATLDHMAFINRGDRFEAVALPTEAQFAPAFYAGVADFNGDGFEDVFLAQNFSPTAVGTPRYDAGRGLLLEGDGTGGLKPASGARSGIVVYGDQRGAAYSDYDGDGRLDLVVSQNGSTTKLFRNLGAKPGLRVRLEGRSNNPDGVGAQVRLVHGQQLGPVREVHAGSGFWSQNGAVQVFGSDSAPTSVWVRWPGGRETRVDVPAGAREVVVKQ
jgi:hypothetical protein